MRLGICDTCGKPAEAEYRIQGDLVYLAKNCRKCGETITLVSKDSAKWQWKREISSYREPEAHACLMNCGECDHQQHTPPLTVGIDITNRCNQKCPICLAYVDAMGFDYHPPIEYFEKIFRHFQKQNPRPNMCFFGGEPTVHDQFIDIVKLARGYGLNVQIFTNGLKFANKDFCREVCSLGIQVNFGFDGTRMDIYETLRGDHSLKTKRIALENIIEQGVNKLVIISTLADGVNDDNLLEIMDFIHEYRDHVSVWAFVPLTPCWESKEVQLEPTSTECVEKMFERVLEDIEFVPTGMLKFKVLSRFFGRQTMGGSHPNCESATLAVSDGESYAPISRYLKIPLSSMLRELKQLDESLLARSTRTPETGLSRKWFDLAAFFGMISILRRSIDFDKTFKGSKFSGIANSLADLARGRKVDQILSERTHFQRILTMMTIPYEDVGGLEDARVKDCPAVFAYEDVETGAIRTTAFCTWQTIKDKACQSIQAYYHPIAERKQVKA